MDIYIHKKNMFALSLTSLARPAVMCVNSALYRRNRFFRTGSYYMIVNRMSIISG